MRSFRVLIDAKVWTLRERHDPAQPSCSAYLAAHGRVRGTVAPRSFALHMSPARIKEPAAIRQKNSRNSE